MTVNINLLPWREVRKEEQKREYLTYLAIGLIITGLILLGIHFVITRWISGQQSVNHFLEAKVKVLDSQIVEINALEKEKKQLLDRMEIIQELQKSRPQVVQFFDGLVRIIPDGLHLTNIARTGEQVLIDGRAESNTRVSTFMRNIEGSKWLKRPVLTLIEAEDTQNNPSGRKQPVYDGMIDFHLRALEAFPGKAVAEEGAPEKGKRP